MCEGKCRFWRPSSNSVGTTNSCYQFLVKSTSNIEYAKCTCIITHSNNERVTQNGGWSKRLCAKASWSKHLLHKSKCLPQKSKHSKSLGRLFRLWGLKFDGTVIRFDGSLVYVSACQSVQLSMCPAPCLSFWHWLSQSVRVGWLNLNMLKRPQSHSMCPFQANCCSDRLPS